MRNGVTLVQPSESAEPGRVPYVLAVGKAISILNSFLDGSAALTLAEVSQRARLSRSTCHRLLATLERSRLIERSPDGRYLLGIRLFQLGSLVAAPAVWARVAEPAMSAAADAMQIGCFLSIRDGDRSLCVARVNRGQVILAPYLVGETLPLHVGAAPMILLSAMRDDAIDRVLEQPLEALAPATSTDSATIRLRVARIRRDGYAIASDGDIAPGISAVGAPVHDPAGQTVAAVSLSGIASQIHERSTEMVDVALQAAAAIGHELRSDPGEPPSKR